MGVLGAERLLMSDNIYYVNFQSSYETITDQGVGSLCRSNASRTAGSR